MGDGFEFGLYDPSHIGARAPRAHTHAEGRAEGRAAFAAAAAKEHNMIVVAPNYRLSALGFLAHRLLAEEDPQGTTGAPRAAPASRIAATSS